MTGIERYRMLVNGEWVEAASFDQAYESVPRVPVEDNRRSEDA